jgi:arabinofuranosyltransferase
MPPPADGAVAATPARATAAGTRARDALLGRIFAGLGVGLLCARVALLADRDLLVDDAFISFRYAANLARGAGLVFNAGERVEGYTNFLWTLLLAAGIRCGIEPGLLAGVVSALAAAGTVLVLAHLLRRLLAPAPRAAAMAGFAGLLYGAMASQARFVVSGLETVFFVFLLTLAWDLALARGRLWQASAVFAAAAMTRPEGLLYWGLTVAGVVLFAGRGAAADGAAGPPASRWRTMVALVAPFLVLFGAYFLWRLGYYGDLLPNTFYAKASDPSFERLRRGASLLADVATRWALGPLLVLALASLVPRRASQLREEAAARAWAWLVMLATTAYFVFIGGDFIVFFGPRLLLPALPALLYLAAVGLGRLLPGPGDFPHVARLGVGVVLLFAAVWWSWPARFYRLDGQALEMEAWSRLGHWLADHTPQDASVATGAAGAIPYYSGRATLDMFGLTDRHIAHRRLRVASPNDPPAHEKYDPRYILLQRPEVIVATHIDRAGHATTAGLDQVTGEMEACYRLVAVSKSQRPWPADDRWIVPAPPYTPQLVAAGYKTGIYLRRRGPDAKDCDAALHGLAAGAPPGPGAATP